MSFLEFLAYNDFTSSAIANHMSAVRTKFAMLGLDTSPFHDPRIKYFTKSITHLGQIGFPCLTLDTRLRKHFKNIITALNLGQSSLTFHSFRRSGATMAFNSEVPIQDIQSHGTWTSDCVWSYITQNHDASDKVALAFQHRLLQ